MRRALLVAILLVVAGVAGAYAQEQQGPRAVGEYAGVAPGTGHLPPRAPNPGTARLMTWPGFQARPDGASRFFLQTTQSVVHRLERADGRVKVVLEGVGIHLRNNRRPLETAYFNTPVTRARVERRGRDAVLVLEMRNDVTPVVSVQAGSAGFHYVIVEFPAGDYLPEEFQTGASVRPAANVPAEPIDHQDDERPPSLQ